MANGKLTPKQELFVAEYLIDLNATAAYRRAGYQAATDNVAAVEAHNLLRNPKITAAITAAQSGRAERLQITQDDVLRGLMGEARRLGEGSSHSARVAAWGLLGKHLGMFRDKLDVNVRGPAFKIYVGFDPESV